MEKIYVRMIDGGNTSVPVNAEKVGDRSYRILNDEEYSDSDSDPGVLFQFYPGDIVEVDDTGNVDHDFQYAAKRLIQPAKTEDRNYLNFKFHATLWLLPINKQNAERFKGVLERIKKESIAGQYFYQGIRETASRLEQLL